MTHKSLARLQADHAGASSREGSAGPLAPDPCVARQTAGIGLLTGQRLPGKNWKPLFACLCSSLKSPGAQCWGPQREGPPAMDALWSWWHIIGPPHI